MDINLLKLVFDTGLFILIWMVQLVVYPSFAYYEKENLVKWHKHYTKGLALLVIPLMFGQLIIGFNQLVTSLSINNLLIFLLILSVWMITFIQFVPMHNKITNNKATDKLLKQLIHRNWSRTIIWTLIFIWSIKSFF